MALETLHAAGRDRSGVQKFQERLGLATAISFRGGARGGAHLRVFPGVLFAGYAAPAIERVGGGTDAAGGAGDAGRGPDAGLGITDERWAVAGDEPIHPAGQGSGTLAGAAETATTRTAPAATERTTHAGNLSVEWKNVVKTF